MLLSFSRNFENFLYKNQNWSLLMIIYIKINFDDQTNMMILKKLEKSLIKILIKSEILTILRAISSL